MTEAIVDTIAGTIAAAGVDATASTSAEDVPALVSPGTLIGRYVVLSRLGAGAMGVVLAAYDPELDRKVALKLLEPRPGSQEAARQRLRREAQALAKLDHRNVVSVYDVGVHEGRLFVGMEFVEGQTLGAWMAAAGPRPWRQVLRVFRAAGRGLAAAHQAGLVHRDFKPDNVMISGPQPPNQRNAAEFRARPAVGGLAFGRCALTHWRLSAGIFGETLETGGPHAWHAVGVRPWG